MNPFRLRPRRPRGVTVLAAWSVVVGVGVVSLASYAVYGIGLIPRAFASFAGVPHLLVALAGIVAVLEVATALGLWWLRWWGWLLAVAFSLAGIAFGALTLPFGAVGIGFGLASLAYLRTPEVRTAFRLPARRRPAR